MRILLVYPPVTVHPLDRTVPSKPNLLGLCYIAQAVRDKGHEVRILEGLPTYKIKTVLPDGYIRYGFTDEEIKKSFVNFNPNVVGISCMYTPYYSDAFNVAKIIKAINPGIPIVFGGSHTSTFPKQVLLDNNVDYVVVGEGEVAFVKLIDWFERFGEYPLIIDNKTFIEDLDTVSFPARDLVNYGLICFDQLPNLFQMRKPVAYMITSRGCPGQCYYCSVKLSWGQKWRARSVKNVVNEIESLLNRYKEFHFCDDNCSVSPKRLHEICDEIINRKLDIRWTAPTGIAYWTLDKDLLKKMKKSGCYRLTFGIESCNPNTLAIIGKNHSLQTAKKVIREANRLGMWTVATFIIGFPHETKEDVEYTIKHSLDFGLDLAIYYSLNPQPGTKVYEIMKQEGLIDVDKWLDPTLSEYPHYELCYKPVATKNLTVSEIEYYLSYAYESFFWHKLFSIKTYINLLLKIRSFEDLRYLAGIVYKTIFKRKEGYKIA